MKRNNKVDTFKKILILTVGGSPQPIIKSIKENNPDFTVFICSDDSPTIKGSYTQIIDKPNILFEANMKEDVWIIQKISFFDDLNDCYNVSKKAMEEMRRRFIPCEIFVDYTGGTKSMSAGLVAAALDDGNCKIVLVAGTRSNLEKVTDKSEYVKLVSHHDTLANKNIGQVTSLLKRFDFSGAVNLLETSIKLPLSNEKNQELQKDLNICRGFDAWDRFDHSSTYQFLNPYRKYLVPYIIPLERIKTAIENNALDYLLVEDLLLNAERRAIQGRYEDAVGRIYRAVELIAQVRLKHKYNMETGNINIDSLSQLKEDFKIKLDNNRNNEANKIQIGLMLSYELLVELQDPVITPWYQNNKNKIMNFLSYRNNSLFAHGVKAIDRSAYEDVAHPFMELLQQVTNEIYKNEKGKYSKIPQFPDGLQWGTNEDNN